MKVADFFCGGGGFSEGFRQAGFDVCFAIDKWTPAINTYKGNKPNVNVVQRDIIEVSNLPDEEFHKLIPDTEIIIGSPPCVAFSNSNKSGNGDKELGILLVKAYLRIVARKKFKKGSKLKYWILENVPNLEKEINEKYTQEDLGLIGKRILTVKGNSTGVYNARDFGAPTNRKRFLCGEFPGPKEIISNGDYKTLLDVIASLKGNEERIVTDCNYPDLKMKYENVTDHDYEYLLEEFEWKTAERLKKDRGYMGKMAFPENMNKPSRTVMATMSACSRESMILDAGNENEYRLPTVREAASMMSFPIDYRFFGSTKSIKHTLVGNAVPPKLSYALGKAIAEKEKMVLPDEYIQIRHDESIEFMDLNGSTFKPREEKEKRENARFKYHIPYLIKSSYRVELTNYHSDSNSKKYVWDVEIHHSQGKKASVYCKNDLIIMHSLLDSETKESIRLFVDSMSPKLCSFNEFQKVYRMTKISRGEKIGPFELLDAVKDFLTNDLTEDNTLMSVSMDNNEVKIPKIICIGYCIVEKLIESMETRNNGRANKKTRN